MVPHDAAHFVNGKLENLGGRVYCRQREGDVEAWQSNKASQIIENVPAIETDQHGPS